MINEKKFIKVISKQTASGVSEQPADIRNQDVYITRNGTYTATDGYTGIGVAVVNVPTAADLGTKSITANGNYSAESDNLDGFSSVSVNVPVQANLGTTRLILNGTYSALDYGYDGFSEVTVAVPSYAIIDSLTVSPTKERQVITATSVDGYNPVTVNAVTSAIDSNIKAGNIKNGVTILGVEGTYTGEGIIPTGTINISNNGTVDVTNYASAVVNVSGSSPVINSLSITPSTSAQTITAPSGVNGYSPISVSAVTSSIDANITAANIKSGITILGVTGTYSGSANQPLTLKKKLIEITGGSILANDPAQVFSDFGFVSNNIQNVFAGVFYGAYRGNSSNTGTINLSTLKWADSYAFYDCFYNNRNITAVDLSSLEDAYIYSFGTCFANCTSLTTVNLSSLEVVDSAYVFQECFYGCTSLTTVNLSNLRVVQGNNAFNMAFQGCTNLTNISLDNLEEVSGSYSFQSMFAGCTSLTTMSFPSLINLKSSFSSVLTQMFKNCTSLTTLSFGALRSNSFGSNTSQFNNMLSGCTGVTVHFPSNLQSVIGSWSSVTNGFGGINTTVLFDLPATT